MEGISSLGRDDAHHSKYNLLNSAILELLKHIGIAPYLTPVLKYVLDKYGTAVEQIPSARAIIVDLRSMIETRAQDRAAIASAASLVKDETRYIPLIFVFLSHLSEKFKELVRDEKDEEAWFSEDEGGESNTPPTDSLSPQAGASDFLETMKVLETRKRQRVEDEVEPNFFDRFSPKSKRRKSTVESDPSSSAHGSPAPSLLSSPSLSIPLTSPATPEHSPSPRSSSPPMSPSAQEHRYGVEQNSRVDQDSS